MNKYYDNFQMLKCTTQIQLEKDGYYAFDETVFYGEKGGQPSDKGTINGYSVVDLKWEGDTLYHKVDGPVQNPVTMEIDADTRYLNTSIQSALHLLDGFYDKKGMKLISVGAEPNNQWYELDSKEVTAELLSETEDFMQDVIRQEIPVKFTYMNGKDYPVEFYQQFDELRIVHFGEINVQPCGTCHVNHTGQIGNFVILDTENTKQGTKVMISVGDAIPPLMKEYYDLSKKMARLMNTKMDDVVTKMSDLLTKQKNLQKENKELKQEWAQYKTDEWLNSDEQYIHYDIVDMSELQLLAQSLSHKVNGEKILLSSKGDTYYFAIVSSNGKARELFNQLKVSYPEINGGGSPKVVSGRLIKEQHEGFVEAITSIGHTK